MQLLLSNHDGVPIYQQIVNQVKYLVSSGALRADERLPSVRRLAEQLLINPNTVARAYRALEREGLLVTRRGDGVFVSDAGSRLAADERQRIIEARVDVLLSEARQLGMPFDRLIEVVRARAGRLTGEEPERS